MRRRAARVGLALVAVALLVGLYLPTGGSRIWPFTTTHYLPNFLMLATWFALSVFLIYVLIVAIIWLWGEAFDDPKRRRPEEL